MQDRVHNINHADDQSRYRKLSWEDKLIIIVATVYTYVETRKPCKVGLFEREVKVVFPRRQQPCREIFPTPNSQSPPLGSSNVNSRLFSHQVYILHCCIQSTLYSLHCQF